MRSTRRARCDSYHRAQAYSMEHSQGKAGRWRVIPHSLDQLSIHKPETRDQMLAAAGESGMSCA